VLVVQANPFNRSNLATVVCVALTSQMRWADAPGNVTLNRRQTGLPKSSVANVSQLVTLDKYMLTERVGKIPAQRLAAVFAGIDVVFGRVGPRQTA
jgi:mRNA interferase MazF